MSEIRNDLRYTSDHEWVREVGDQLAIVGITDFAQASLGDITFVELPAPGDVLEAGDAFGVVESVKAASDLYMPISGEVLEINEALADNPELVNSSPYENGWMIRIRVTNTADIVNLLSPDAYKKSCNDG